MRELQSAHPQILRRLIRESLQPDLFTRAPRFDGPELTAGDEQRFGGQLAKVRALMQDGKWRTLEHIALLTGASEAGASARLRDLRKAKFGGHTVERRRVKHGGAQYEYRVSRVGGGVDGSGS